MNASNKYEKDLGKNPANHVPLSPLSFCRRTAEVFPDHVAVIHGEQRRSKRAVNGVAAQLGDLIGAVRGALRRCGDGDLGHW